jgi:hypothetical protein
MCLMYLLVMLGIYLFIYLFNFSSFNSLFNFSLLYYFLGCFFYLFFSLLLLFMYMPMNIHIHYLLFVTLCGQFCSWVNKSYYYKCDFCNVTKLKVLLQMHSSLDEHLYEINYKDSRDTKNLTLSKS